MHTVHVMTLFHIMRFRNCAHPFLPVTVHDSLQLDWTFIVINVVKSHVTHILLIKLDFLYNGAHITWIQRPNPIRVRQAVGLGISENA